MHITCHVPSKTAVFESRQRQGQWGMDGLMAPMMLGMMGGGNMFGNFGGGGGGQSQGGDLFGNFGGGGGAAPAVDPAPQTPDVNSAVHYIIGTESMPDEGLKQLVAQKGWPPKDATVMIEYVPHFQRIARATFAPHLAKIALETVKQAAPSGANATLAEQLKSQGKPTSVASAVKEMKQLTNELNNLVFQKAVEWADQYLTPQATGQQSQSNNGGMNMAFPFLMDGFGFGF
ncbi:hypothetical protein MAR_017635 [Mya arenaria]|uniref:Uncharacterized protein n=1 Tax=Mya arenaria TaxID=6604 RepID=A0ABY7EFT9_MYAAR|nr:hypothetical protein MAR_017635 [Mya arenaria]